MLRETTESGVILPGEVTPNDPKLDPTLLVQQDTPAQALPQQVYERMEYDIAPAEAYLQQDIVDFICGAETKVFVACERKSSLEVAPISFTLRHPLDNIRAFYAFVDVNDRGTYQIRRFTTDEFFDMFDKAVEHWRNEMKKKNAQNPSANFVENN